MEEYYIAELGGHVRIEYEGDPAKSIVHDTPISVRWSVNAHRYSGPYILVADEVKVHGTSSDYTFDGATSKALQDGIKALEILRAAFPKERNL